jgi:hypothetical protein
MIIADMEGMGKDVVVAQLEIQLWHLTLTEL